MNDQDESPTASADMSKPYELLVSKEYKAAAIEGTTIEHVEIEPDNLYVFLDDIGEEKFSPGHHFFGYFACAILGRDYDDAFRAAWKDIKSNVLRVPSGKPVVAKHHLKKLQGERSAPLLEAIEGSPIKFGCSFALSNIGIIGNVDLIYGIVDGVADQLGALFNKRVDKDVWIFQESTRHAPQLLFSGNSSKCAHSISWGGICFMSKQACEPMLEIADIGAHVVHAYLDARRRNAKFKYKRLGDMFFLDHSRGRMSQLLGAAKIRAKPPALGGKPSL